MPEAVMRKLWEFFGELPALELAAFDEWLDTTRPGRVFDELHTIVIGEMTSRREDTPRAP